MKLAILLLAMIGAVLGEYCSSHSTAGCHTVCGSGYTQKCVHGMCTCGHTTTQAPTTVAQTTAAPSNQCQDVHGCHHYFNVNPCNHDQRHCDASTCTCRVEATTPPNHNCHNVHECGAYFKVHPCEHDILCEEGHCKCHKPHDNGHNHGK